MEFDVVVVGAGAVGASLARALRGLSVALVSGSRPSGARPASSDEFDPRVYALSPGSVAFLRSIKAWDLIEPSRLTPVRAMRVFGDAPDATLAMDAYRAGVPELAWIVEDRALQAALWSALSTQDRLETIAPAACVSIDFSATAAQVRLADGRMLDTALVVGADGADSFVRSAAGIGVRQRAYGQSAVVANFACEREHANVASQWFQGGPVLALLPLPGRRVSMVWSVPDAQAERLLALAPDLLAREVSAACGEALGELTLVSTVHAFALKRLEAHNLVRERVALAGDAAHVVHPLAGQGLNLGLQDASALAALIANREPVRGVGDFTVLRRYERERREAILAMRSMVHGLYCLFDAKAAAVGRARNLGLNLTDRLPVLKNALLRHALR